jgi:hypothetical protein
VFLHAAICLRTVNDQTCSCDAHTTSAVIQSCDSVGNGASGRLFVFWKAAIRPSGVREAKAAAADTRSSGYSFLKYASSASRSSGFGCRSNVTPSVVATEGTTPGGALAFTRLKNSM